MKRWLNTLQLNPYSLWTELMFFWASEILFFYGISISSYSTIQSWMKWSILNNLKKIILLHCDVKTIRGTWIVLQFAKLYNNVIEQHALNETDSVDKALTHLFFIAIDFHRGKLVQVVLCKCTATRRERTVTFYILYCLLLKAFLHRKRTVGFDLHLFHWKHVKGISAWPVWRGGTIIATIKSFNASLFTT